MFDENPSAQNNWEVNPGDVAAYAATSP